MAAAPAETGSGPAISLREAELLGWVLGDGWVIHFKSRTPESTHWRTQRGTRPSVRLGQSKPEHVKRIDQMVSGLLFTRTVRRIKKPNGEVSELPLVTWEFHRPYSAELLRRSGYNHQDPVPFVLSLSLGQREAFLRGVFGAEGYLSGMRPGFTPWRMETRRNLDCANPKTGGDIRETKPFLGGEKIRREDAGRGTVWCVTTDLGTWTMRQGQQVMLTGNGLNRG